MTYTNIIATVGPSCESLEMLEDLAKEGVGVFRFNFSHGTHAYHKRGMDHVRSMSEKGESKYALLLDTKGPEIRTADLKHPVKLKKDDLITLTVQHGSYEDMGKIEVNYDGFVDDVSVGDKILVDNGTINFLVKEKTEQDVVCEILDGGTLKSRRHINLPGVDPSMATITKKDWKDIDFGIAENVDFIALSFVRREDEIFELRSYLKKKGAEHIKIIAKIESYEATQNLEAIIKAADGIMVARGDLGAEVPFEQVPRLQRDIVRLSMYYRTPVIVATHMLESMIEHPIPTRAEVNDVSMAVWQKADCIMMSGETASGKYPLKSTIAMASIAQEVEKDLQYEQEGWEVEVLDDKMAFAELASRVGESTDDIESIVVITKSGTMARYVSSFRPSLPLFVCTERDSVQRQMQLHWGCEGMKIDFDREHPDLTAINAEKEILRIYPEKKGSKYFLVTELLEDKKFIPTLQVRTLDGKG